MIPLLTHNLGCDSVEIHRPDNRMRNQFCSPGLRFGVEARNSSLQVYQPGELYYDSINSIN